MQNPIKLFDTTLHSTYLLSNLYHISPRQHVKVGHQRTTLNDLSILYIVQAFPKENILPQSGVLYPGLLGDVGHTTLLGGQEQYCECCNLTVAFSCHEMIKEFSL